MTDLREQIAVLEYTRMHKPGLDLLSGFAGEVTWEKAPHDVKNRSYFYADQILALFNRWLAEHQALYDPETTNSVYPQLQPLRLEAKE